MKILVINCGSSSIKYQLLDMDTENVIAKGLVERIGIDGSRIVHSVNGKKTTLNDDIKDHEKGLKLVLDILVSKDLGVLNSLDEIDAIGHRVVHGGEKFASSVRINSEMLNTMEMLSFLAPLHNPANITGIKAAMRILPNVPQIGVFDTAFHQTMPEKSFMYAIPKEYYDKYKVRRYGFHGTSHRYVSQRAAKFLGKDVRTLKIITVHVGNGGSVAAVCNGRSVDTSMGFTPLEGLVMGTRCGDIDPSIVTFLQQEEGLSSKQVNDILNKKSGMIGLTNGLSDMRDIENGAMNGDAICTLAHDIYEYRIAKYIGAYTAAMNGVDVIVFTAGVGENSPLLRKNIVTKYLGYLGITLDEQKNNMRGDDNEISTKDSKVKVLVIPTNEELMIARDTKEIVEKNLNELKTTL
ncbi:MAG TPA: acetate kinase [Petrotogaceae bacterium]|nr:acetate kinase [Petrotogaceae bacterium]HQF33117.1 acetate kinase [Petrotogaceae bacterium]HQH33870.1 acetate kinase [Petrotogaceae bacterium]